MNTRLKSSAIIWTATVLIIATLGIHGAIFLLAPIAYFSQLELYQMFEKMGFRPMKQPSDRGSTIFILTILVA